MIGLTNTLGTVIEPEDYIMPAEINTRGYHVPVLMREVLEFLAPAPGKVIVDGTLGGGGHTTALLDNGATVFAFDQDPEAFSNFASLRLGGFLGRFRPVQANFQNVEAELEKLGVTQIDGALLDLGVSSHQLDTPERGFSLQADGPLDMRMSPETPMSAAELVNTASEEELARIFRDFGDEPSARRVAVHIARQRVAKMFTTTLQLADCISGVLPKKSRIHPATRCFQALRIAVNRELEVLTSALESFSRLLVPGGRIAVISFHSGEDRIVKNFFRDHAAEWLDRPEWPAPRRNPDYIFRLITPHPVIATEEEQKNNPRSRSAKLRVAERLSHARK
jgi:16S rRNA (cytosine1402-N4)-methyltransferase